MNRVFWVVAMILALSASLAACREGTRGCGGEEEVGATSGPMPSTGLLEALTDPGRCPYLHNPVTWRYLTVVRRNDQVVSQATVAMTTTWERQTIDGLGALFKLVVEQEPMSSGEMTGDRVTQRYQSRHALLTPQGLTLSQPDTPFVDDEEAVRALQAAAPDWPLPGHAGCTARSGDFGLSFGQVRGSRTICPSLDTDRGPSRVTTVWVDRVGFVYRQIEPLTDNPDGQVFRDILVSGDLVELAERSASDRVTILMP